jgi:hypothetical protein
MTEGEAEGAIPPPPEDYGYEGEGELPPPAEPGIEDAMVPGPEAVDGVEPQEQALPEPEPPAELPSSTEGEAGVTDEGVTEPATTEEAPPPPPEGEAPATETESPEQEPAAQQFSCPICNTAVSPDMTNCPGCQTPLSF